MKVRTFFLVLIKKKKIIFSLLFSFSHRIFSSFFFFRFPLASVVKLLD